MTSRNVRSARARSSVSPFALLAVALLASTAGAQVHERWSHLHDSGPQRTDKPTAIAVASNGDIHVTGDSFNQAPPLQPHYHDAATVVYDAAGNLKWSALFGSGLGFADYAHCLAISPQGDTYVGGATGQTSSPFGTQQMLLKYLPNGALHWAMHFGNPPDANIGALLADASGDLFVGGTDSNAGGLDICIRRLDPLGNILWTATYDGSHQLADVIWSMARAPNGDIVASGQSTISAQWDSDLVVLRVSDTGNVIWARELGGGFAGVSDVAVDAAGNSYAATSFNGDMSLVALDPAGAVLWSRNVDGGANGADGLGSIGIDRFGRLVASGNSTSALQDVDASVVVSDTSGNIVWTRTWDDAAHGHDHLGGMALDALGNIHLVGAIQPLASLTFQAFSIGYDPTGALRYTELLAPTGNPNGETFDHVAIGSGDIIAIAGSAAPAALSTVDFLTRSSERTAVPYCFGDGSGTACPCGNASASIAQSGCQSSLGVGGRLIDAGASSLSGDTFVLHGSDMPSSSALYFQATSQIGAGMGLVFGDGLRCAGGPTLRLATRTNVAGVSQYPAAGDPSVSVRGGVSAPGTHTYQVWYRNAAAFCTASTFNLTNGLLVAWVP